MVPRCSSSSESMKPLVNTGNLFASRSMAAASATNASGAAKPSQLTMPDDKLIAASDALKEAAIRYAESRTYADYVKLVEAANCYSAELLRVDNDEIEKRLTDP